MDVKTNLLFFLFPFRGHSIQAIKIIKMLNDTGKYNILVDVGKEYEGYLPDNIEKHICLYKFKSKDYRNRYSKDELINYAEGILNTVVEYRLWFINCGFTPDLVCFDSLAYWGKVISEENAIQSISLHTIQPFDNKSFRLDAYKYLYPYVKAFSDEQEFKRTLHIYERVSMCKYKIQKDFAFSDLLCAKGNNNIVLIPEDMCKYSNVLNDTFQIYNPIMDGISVEGDIKEKTQDIYISTGSIISNKEYLCKCIEALALFESEIYVSGGKIAEELREKYRNNKKIHIYDFAPQIELLKKCKLFITHGGMNSICESIYCETPMIVIPFINDEYLNAKMVEENGIGLILKEENTIESGLIDLFNTIIHNKKFNDRIHYFSNKMKSIDTKTKVIELFEDITVKRNSFLQ